MVSGGINKTIITGTISLLFAAVLFWWIFRNQTKGFSERIPGADNRPELKPRSESVIIGEFFDTLGVFDEFEGGSWPRFRGIDFDNINKDTVQLSEKWDTTGPQILWKAPLGEGYSGPAVFNSRVYLLDYNERKKADMLRCFSLKTGKELWRRWYYVDLKRNHGYSRTIPAVTEKYIVTMGPRGHVMCVNPLTGAMLWSLDLEKLYKFPGKEREEIVPDFYTGQCPLIDNGIAVIAPGGKVLMTGIDCATGKVAWETPNPDSIRMSHCSIMPMVLCGKKMYVYHGIGGVSGISAEKADLGRLLWKTTEWSPAIVAASPLFIGNNEMVVFGAYGAGGARINIGKKEGNDYLVTVTEKHKSPEGISSDQQTPVYLKEHIWSLMPENAGALKKQLACFERKNLLNPVWSSGKENRFGRGLGPYIVSGDKMYLLDDNGELFMYKLAGSTAKMISSHKILNGIEAWGPMAIAGKYLIMRDSRNLLCLNIGKY